MTGVLAVATTADILAALVDDGGFTFDPATRTMISIGDRDGWAIARAGTERIIGRDVVADVFAAEFDRVDRDARESGALVGGWYSDQRRVYMLEITDVHTVDRDTALVLGMRADQETVLNLGTGELAAVPQWGDDE